MSTGSRQIRVELVLAIGVAIILAALVSIRGREERALSVREFSLGPPYDTPVVSIKHENSHPGGPVALLIHGFQCNKSMMIQLGKFLALNHIDSYLIDLPGHGASAHVFSFSDARRAAHEAFEELLRSEELAKRRVALVGHSYGATIISEMGMIDDFWSHTLIGPGYAEGYTTERPRNVLILLAENDHPYVRDYSYQLLSEGTGAQVDEPSELFGSPQEGNARRLDVIPGAAHVNLLWNDAVYSATRSWIEQTVLPERGSASAEVSGTKTLSIAIAALSVVMGTLLIATLAAYAPTAYTPSSSFLSGSPFRDLAVLACAAAAGTAISWVSRPFPLLRIHEGGSIGSILLWTGLLSGAFLCLWERRFRLPAPTDLLLSVVAGLAATGILYGCVALGAGSELYHTSFSTFAGRRFGNWILLSICFIPFFASGERCFRSLEANRASVYAGVLVSSLAGLLFFSLFVQSFRGVGPIVYRFAAPLLGVVLYAHAVNALLYQRLGSALPGAIFSALIAAWAISVGFLVY